MRIFLATATLTMALLTGCTPQPQQPQHPNVMLGPGISQFVSIDAQPGGRTHSGLLRQGVRIHNHSSHTRKVRFRVVWFDPAGFTLDNLSSRWEVHTLHPGEPVTLSRISSSPKATHYRIDLFSTQPSHTSSTEGTKK